MAVVAAPLLCAGASYASEAMTTRQTDDLVLLVIVVVAALLLVPLLGMAVMIPMMGTMGGMWGGSGMGGSAWSPLVGLGGSLLWLGVVAVLAYAAYRVAAGRGDGESDPAIAELRRAYARGELTDEEYETRLTRLVEEE